MLGENRLRNALLTLAGLAVLAAFMFLVDRLAAADDPIRGIVKFRGALTLFAIWGVAAVSLNLINGTLGILSLGHHGFMLIGGYTTGLLILSEQARSRILLSARSQMTEGTLGLSVSNGLSALGLDFLTTPETLWVRFLIAVLLGGFAAAFAGMLVGIPSLRLRGDYLAIVTFGFGEIIRLSASTRLFSPLTNGALGFPGLPQEFGKGALWTFGFLVLTVFVLARLKYSSYGRAMEGIREDEVAAEAMGINLAYHKVLGFVFSAFFAGIAGGLWVSWLGGVRLDFFLFQLTFFFLVALSAGGTGSITGVLLGTAPRCVYPPVRRSTRAELQRGYLAPHLGCRSIYRGCGNLCLQADAEAQTPRTCGDLRLCRGWPPRSGDQPRRSGLYRWGVFGALA